MCVFLSSILLGSWWCAFLSFSFFLFFFSPSFYKVDNPRFRWRSGQHFGKRTGSRGFEFHRSNVVCFSAVVGRKKGAGSLRDPGVVVLGTSECDDSECGRSVFSKQICSFFLSETSDRFTRH